MVPHNGSTSEMKSAAPHSCACADVPLRAAQTLEAFLQSWDGCLVVVSHDRAFMDSVVDVSPPSYKQAAVLSFRSSKHMPAQPQMSCRLAFGSMKFVQDVHCACLR